ncbi:DUF3710 domain-containing protein [Brevibacterium sp. BRM-1]|uniref:DUF3710 domain-containing protein n=1 Tax=Brevibacterium sp. BRM-1 TaxID=2999062 RepID=UPI0022822168|nr:DUF3710 domain-containing protein [Brevibacterium sp. BRM-1]WAL41052.1 DUF3710 domain-containing protein [Brevibacterium sp. BRM-1]
MGIFSRRKRRAQPEAVEENPAVEDSAAEEGSAAPDDSAAEDAPEQGAAAPGGGAQSARAAQAAADADDDDEFAKEAPLDRLEAGPWDAQEDADPELNRLELGALSVPVIDGMQIQLEAEEDSGQIMAVSLIHAGGSLQLQAFAAPKSEGLWREVREQIAQNIAAAGGEARELYTAVGTELIAKIPAVDEEGNEGFRPARFLGVDGPRWFLRGVLGGAGAVDDEVRAALVEVFRGIIVERGTEAMPPREVLPITPPNVGEEPEADAQDDDGFDPFERGPEITEVR